MTPKHDVIAVPTARVLTEPDEGRRVDSEPTPIEVVERWTVRFQGAVHPEVVRTVVADCLTTFAHTRVRAFPPVLVEAHIIVEPVVTLVLDIAVWHDRGLNDTSPLPWLAALSSRGGAAG